MRSQLHALADEKYRIFQEKIIPGGGKILGVYTADLNRLAREILKGDWRKFLDTLPPNPYYEELALAAMVLGAAPLEIDERFAYLDRFLPKITNWAHCDLLCSRLKIVRKNPDEMEIYLRKCLRKGPWHIRFAVVMFLNYYLDERHIDAVLDTLKTIRNPEYYVRMAVAWAISMAFVSFPEKTETLLQSPDALDPTTRKMALRKILDSRQVDDAVKQRIKDGSFFRPKSGNI
ncbi:MAG: DNA alkylation repair protein [Planctomycetia bacterium]|nr:DNA alkylation repair protein [Planctomycetia bacterium]